MTARSRTRSIPGGVGTVVTTSTTRNYDNPVKKLEQCEDVYRDMFRADGTLKDHTFYLRTTTREGGILNYSRISGSSSFVSCSNYSVDFMAGTPVLPTSTFSTSMFTTVLAQTGPTTPKVNLPLFVFELKDIPLMLRHAGNLLLKIREPSRLDPIKEAAASTLAYQFGWKPLLGDLYKLLHFSDAVSKRQLELSMAHTSKGLQRRMTLTDTKTVSVVSTTVNTSVGFNLIRDLTRTQTVKVWGVCRWRVRDNQNFGYRPTHSESFRSALGLNPGQIAVSVWKALPWSWMIDWFANTSNVLQANYNMVHYKPLSLCIMENLKTTETFDPYTISSSTHTGFMSAGTRTRESKRRYVQTTPSVSYNLNVPFLDTFKLSILGSLAILKIPGSTRFLNR